MDKERNPVHLLSSSFQVVHLFIYALKTGPKPMLSTLPAENVALKM